MAGKTLDITDVATPDLLADRIVSYWAEWNQLRAQWLGEKKELRDYIFATDTTKTTNAKLPWKNSTTLPKLCQIRDNLHANYMAALFPHADWLRWEGSNEESEAKDKRAVVEDYMKAKTDMDKFRVRVSQLVLDYIDYGNVFAKPEWVNESKTDPVTGEIVNGYVGPRLVRISPNDIVFNPLAASFEESPKIVRAMKTVGELAKLASKANSEEKVIMEAALNKAKELRHTVATSDITTDEKDRRYAMDGFSSYSQYLGSSYVELLTFYGDIYDMETNEFLESREIVVMDRMYVLSNRPIPTWTGNTPIRHAGWRQRQDNLYAMGPLDNLVGMQYRIDHLENLKADVFDMIAFPVQKIKGDVENYQYEPGARIYVGDEGDVDFMHPDVTALNADTQIQIIEQRMEEMAGAPRQAMGIRTPGEKTAFEVQTLDNASGRVFQNKVTHFEQTFLEPCLNDMLEVARRNMDSFDVIRTVDDETSAVLFSNVTKQDITASGQLRPRGASHFARRNQMVANLSQFLNSAAGTDPAINVHISGYKVAEMFEDLLDLEKRELVEPNIRVKEQAETQRELNNNQAAVAEEEMIEPIEEDEAIA